ARRVGGGNRQAAGVAAGSHVLRRGRSLRAGRPIRGRALRRRYGAPVGDRLGAALGGVAAPPRRRFRRLPPAPLLAGRPAAGGRRRRRRYPYWGSEIAPSAGAEMRPSQERPMPPAPDPPSREQHVNEVVAGYLEAAAAGRAPDRSELLARHPDLA